jgi:replication factor C subunit 2/4
MLNLNIEKKKKNIKNTINTKCNFTLQLNDDDDINDTTNYDYINKKINDKLPWIEKYRPNELKHLILSNIMQNKIKNIIIKKKLPNMILTGSPGTGKTSTILCIAQKIIGSDYKNNILELNASDNRGLDYINSSVLYFCRKKITGKENIRKLIIFDEADNITKKAQNTLSNLIEEFSHNTSFAFTCNDSSKIIESIQSKCIILKYESINKENIKNRLIEICDKELIKYDEKGIDEIIKISMGDIRQAINNLEATYYGYKDVTYYNVNSLCYQPQQETILRILYNIVNYDFFESIKEIDKLKQDSFCGSDILLYMINILKEDNIKIDEDTRINFIKILSDCYIIISDGIDSNLQIYSCLGKMYNYIVATSPK